MHWRTRYLLFAVLVCLSLGLLGGYYRLAHGSGPAAPDTPDAERPRANANATLLMLARNADLPGVLSAMGALERRFNAHFGYPWVLLNDAAFTPEFRAAVRAATNASVSFGRIPSEHWVQPAWVDEERAAAGRARLAEKNMPYAESVSYRNMCRFNSGFFFRHELLQPYKYYWRVEPDVRFHCNMDWDPFWYMADHNKTYSFVISLKELAPTIPTLWHAVRAFTAAHPAHLAPDNSLRWISGNSGRTYNRCHFWSNFEIADLDFFRSQVYTEFFEHLDSTGGFYYERWGDAPVHSIAAALFLPRSALHFFDRIGYTHLPFSRCPRSAAHRAAAACDCVAKDSMDTEPFSCTKRWWEVNAPAGVPASAVGEVVWDEI